jgi:hypothetical protein
MDVMPPRPHTRRQTITAVIVSTTLVLGACSAWATAVITYEQQQIADPSQHTEEPSR